MDSGRIPALFLKKRYENEKDYSNRFKRRHNLESEIVTMVTDGTGAITLAHAILFTKKKRHCLD